MPHHDDPMDLKAYTAAALIGLLSGRQGNSPAVDGVAAEAVKIGFAVRARVRAQLDTEERQAEREREVEADRQREDDNTNF